MLAQTGFQLENQAAPKETIRIQDIDNQLCLLRRKLKEIELLFSIVFSDKVKTQNTICTLEDERLKLTQGQLIIDQLDTP